MSRVSTFIILVVLIAVGACGGGSGDDQTQSLGAGQSTGGSVRTVLVDMVEHAFKAAELGTVKKGETITFKFTNTGAVGHEAIIHL